MTMVGDKVKMCNDCRWCGSGWFLLSPDHRRCYHPVAEEASRRRNPSGDGQCQVGIERKYSNVCGFEGKLWNTDKNGRPEYPNGMGMPE